MQTSSYHELVSEPGFYTYVHLISSSSASGGSTVVLILDARRVSFREAKLTYITQLKPKLSESPSSLISV
jgi:hypothetical protein